MAKATMDVRVNGPRRSFSNLQRIMAQAPDQLSRRMAAALGREGRQFLRFFRADTKQRFTRVRNSKVGNAFKSYVAGKDFNDLRLGIFTRWVAGPLYEEGGVIRAKGKRMAVPVNPKAFTSAGRVKKPWRDPRSFKDLHPVRTRSGNILLVRRRESQRRGWWASEPMYLLIRKTRREPKLRFFKSFIAQAGERGSRLQSAINRATDAMARGI